MSPGNWRGLVHYMALTVPNLVKPSESEQLSRFTWRAHVLSFLLNCKFFAWLLFFFQIVLHGGG